MISKNLKMKSCVTAILSLFSTAIFAKDPLLVVNDSNKPISFQIENAACSVGFKMVKPHSMISATADELEKACPKQTKCLAYAYASKDCSGDLIGYLFFYSEAFAEWSGQEVKEGMYDVALSRDYLIFRGFKK